MDDSSRPIHSDPLPVRPRPPSPALDWLFPDCRDLSTLPLAAALLISLFILGIVSFLIAYAVPVADDYCRANVGWQNAISYATSRYTNWTGRWTSMVVEAFWLSAFNPYRSVPLLLALLFALRFLGLAILFRQSLGLTFGHSLSCSLLFTTVWLSVSPGAGETVLWATGAVENELSLSLALVALAMILGSRWLAAIPCFLIATTLHELVGLALTGAFASVLWMRRHDRRALRPLIYLTLATAILTLFVLLAPGNLVRALRDYPPPPHRLSVILRTLIHLISSVLTWSTAPSTVGLLLFSLGRRTSNKRITPLDLLGWPCVVAGLGLLIAATIYGGPGRVRDLLCFIFLLLLLHAVVWLAPHVEAGRQIRIIGLFLFCVGALVSRNVKDLSVSAIQAPAWRRAVTDRIRTHRFDRISWPPSYFPRDVTSDASNWNNSCAAKYLGLASVSCPTCDPPP